MKQRQPLVVLAFLVLAVAMSNCGGAKGGPVALLYFERTAWSFLNALIKQRCEEAEKLMAPSQRWTVQQNCGSASRGRYLSAQINETSVREISQDEVEVILTGSIKIERGGITEERGDFTVNLRRDDGKWYVYSFE